MSYARTAWLSVEAVHFKVTVVPETVLVRPVGVLGFSVSTWQGGGLIETVLLAWDTFPAASRA